MRNLPIVVADVIAAFEGAWSSEGFYSREHEELRLEEGRRSLSAFVARENASPRVPLAIERDFKFKLDPGDTVVGRWDRVDERPGGIALVDYKTSQIQSQDKADERARKSLKDDQLGLYALAYREMYGVVPARVEMQFVGAGVTGSADVSPEHLERARERAALAAAGIRSARFPAKPGPRSCGRCPYSRFCAHSVARGER
jgi:DNA helicase-2/ATP-dependent DNA helicase PcrA